MRERRAFAAGLAALLVAACGGDRAPALKLQMHKVSRGACPITVPLGRARAPRRLTALAGADGAARSFGKDGLWVLLPDASGPNAVPVHAGYSVKVPWYLDGSGDLRVVGERLDGSGSVSYDAYDVPGPGPRMEASSLVVSAPGCYGIEAEHHGQVISWVFRASAQTTDGPVN